MKTSLSIVIILTTFLIFGCADLNKISYLHNSTNCNTSIEGYFSTPQVYKNSDITPAVLFTSDYKLKFKSGSVIKQNEEGIYFVEKKYSSLHTQDTLFFNKSIIRAIVDANDFCTYGNLKEKECSETTFRFYLQRVDEKANLICLELTSNSKFSYCIEPGKYQITTIVKEISDNFYEMSFPVFDWTFDVKANCANYIGDISIINDKDVNEKNVPIPFYKQDKSQNEGGVFGIVSELLAEHSNDEMREEIANYFNFRIEHSENYKSDAKIPVNICNVDLHLIR